MNTNGSKPVHGLEYYRNNILQLNSHQHGQAKKFASFHCTNSSAVPGTVGINIWLA